MSDAKTVTVQERLLPCPFCGGEAKRVGTSRFVRCLNCHAEAIDRLWNARIQLGGGMSDDKLVKRISLQIASFKPFNGESYNEFARRLICEVRQSALGNDERWQPIETAPQDGSRLLATGGGLQGTVEVCTYNEHVGCWNCETCTLDDRDHEPQGYNRPLFWQPLPEPPAATTRIQERRS